MKVVQINTFSYKATGNIMMSIHQELQKTGNDSFVVWGRGRDETSPYEYYMNDSFSIITHGIYSRIFDRSGFGSKNATLKLIKKLDEIEPDIIHIHNIHGYYINIELLFGYIHQKGIKLVWTLHDCWPITGHCGYFEAVNCEKWKTGCYQCQLKDEYPKSIVLDNCNRNWIDKNRIFSQSKCHIVTVSNWLEGIIRQSYLKNNDIRTIYNGLDFDCFKPTCSNFRKENSLNNKFIILGVASEWNKRKGLDDFIKLSSILDESYQIILVGLTKKQIKDLPNNVIGFERIDNQKELIALYTCADVYFNASIEETMGMTTVEALACGTPAIVYNATALPEIMKGYPSLIAEKKDLNRVVNIISQIKNKPPNKEKLIKYAKEFTKEKMTNSYIQLYQEILCADGIV